METDGRIGLIFGCPFIEEKAYCPFKNIRQLEVQIRLHNYLHDYSEQERCFLGEFHQKCLLLREKKVG